MLTLTDGGEPAAGHRGGRRRQRRRRLAGARAPRRRARRRASCTRASRRCCTPSTPGTLAGGAPATRRRSPSSCCPAPIRRRRSRASVASPTASPGPTPVALWRVKRAGPRPRRHGQRRARRRRRRRGRRATCASRGDDVDEVHALVPFNLRPLDQPLPRELGNRFGLVLLGLPVGIEDPLARLAEVKRRMDAIKDSPRGRVRLRHPRPDGPHAGPARGAPDRLLHRQGLDGPHQRARARGAGLPRRHAAARASSSGRRARAASA